MLCNCGTHRSRAAIPTGYKTRPVCPSVLFSSLISCSFIVDDWSTSPRLTRGESSLVGRPYQPCKDGLHDSALQLVIRNGRLPLVGPRFFFQDGFSPYQELATSLYSSIPRFILYLYGDFSRDSFWRQFFFSFVNVMKEQKNEFTLKGKLRCGHKEQQADFSSSAPQAIRITSLERHFSPHVIITAGINRSNTAARAVLEQPCSTGGRTDTVRPKREPTGRTDLSDRSRLVLCNRSQELIGQACPTRRQVLRSDSACPTTCRTRLFEHRSNCRVRPVNAGSV
ncbi:hypothetical protein PCANC_10845 [Puccinia coronata f. sp. avenae]|uniref:Uncharacterized protein n=1 Tax=Puccinia coronata f. sp. avenae TaxID=200324 RepID=A0A2N5V0Y1_9BASI|nr:hypothetical protein PCANC_10845 [Puccinia coronata f. sp. avenae]